MKKTIFASIGVAFGVFLLAVALCPTVFALAQQPTLHEKIEKQLTSIEEIKDARVLLYDDCALVAIRTQNVPNKTLNDQLTQSVKDFFSKNYPQYKEVLVTCSVKMFVAIERINQALDTGKVDFDELKDKFPQPKPKHGIEEKLPQPDVPKP